MTTAVDDTYDRYTVSGTGPYAFSFRIFDSTDLTVTVLESGDVDPVTLNSSQYTVTGEDDVDGGTVTLTFDTATTYDDYTIDIRSNVPVSQPTSIKNQGSFLPVIHETAFDRLNRQIQDLARKVRAAFRYPDNTDLDGVMTNRSSWLSKYLYVNSSGVVEPATSIGSTALTQSVIGETLYPRTAAEIAASVTPVNYARGPLIDVRRYGAIGDSGTTDCSTAVANAALAASICGGEVWFPVDDANSGGYYKLTDEITLSAGVGVQIDAEVRQVTRNKNCFIAANNSRFWGRGKLRGDNDTGAANLDKNNGIYADGKSGVEIIGLRFSHFERAIQIRNCQNYKVNFNTITDGPYDVTDSGTSPESDILVYSLASATGLRGQIIGNHCLSNNDIGIYHNANGFDLDYIISQNICVTLSSGSEAASGGNRRHGILVTYAGGASGRTVITHNICRNTKLTGIYRTGTTGPTVAHIITNNYCSANGADTTNSLAGGIYLGNVATGDMIANNIIDGFLGTQQSTNGSIVVNAATGRPVLSGNHCINSAGHGIVLTGTASHVTIKDGLMSGNTLEDIVVNTNNTATLGGNEIDGVIFFKAVDTAACIYIATQAATNANRIINCRAKGANLTDAESGENSFIGVAGVTTPLVVENNEIDTFYYGVFGYTNIPSGRGFAHFKIDSNTFRNLNTGVLLPRATDADVVVCCDNTFISVTTKTSGCYTGLRQGDRLMLTNVTAAPSDGTWIAGDSARFDAPAAGASPGSNCTTGGNPGTWKAWAALAA
jgi:hypothetical protein